jgi:glycosyltransferase involved in cell wall biosynthesis
MSDNCSDKIIDLLQKLDIDGNHRPGGTDKNHLHSYVEVYGKYLAKYLEKSGNILEIGVRFGGSALLWHELLPKFNLCLVDREELLDPINSLRMDPSRVFYLISDAYQESVKDSLKQYYTEKFDIITDDGPHTLESQLSCIDLYLDLLKDDGVLIIEDIENTDNLQQLIHRIPENYEYEIFDLRNIKGRYDDIALVIKKKIMKNKKIVMIAMFKNEATVMKRMLESCYKYIDFFVVQNNGSTDGTDIIVKEFFEEKNIPGFMYNVEEGWVGFGWNRDHLIQVCQNIDHGCDWILKMDCDEVLEVDEDFDWTLIDDTSIQSFHIAAVSGSCIYYRAWMWNANLPWRFNHDTCHETIYCDIEGIGEAFQRVNLPKSFRQVGYNEGQSWGVPTKFISDALILEEKMIKENTMLSDLYHFWYIAKSYTDSYPCTDAFPLGISQQKEYAKRAIYYYGEYVTRIHPNFSITKLADFEDELSYISLIFAAEAYTFLEEYDNAIDSYKNSETFAPGRNDHLYGLARIYETLKQYDNMLICTTEMMKPERVNPFPKYEGFINTAIYHDGGSLINELHEFALSKLDDQTPLFNFNIDKKPRLFVVDNFYSDPDAVRNFALTSVEYQKDLRWYKGLRSTKPYRQDGMKEAFEKIIGEKINNFEEHGFNGCFQLMMADDPQVYHYDNQKWAAMIYLTPNAPIESGTRLHRSNINGSRHSSDLNVDESFSYGFYDSTKFDVLDSVGNIYNRLIIMDAQCLHSAGPYFGNTKETGRLTHLFFFD